MLELARAGAAHPSADEVAERAGVGRRTVFRLFNDMEGLYREMHALMVRRLQPMLLAPFEGANWRAQLDELIERRARVFEEMLPIKSAADGHRGRSPFLQKEHAKLTRFQREALVAVLPPAVRNESATLEALDLALSFESWRRLRHEQRLSRKAAVAALQRIVAALLSYGRETAVRKPT
ncbi:MAG: TetR family transcriptional regulator [Hyphomonadaceae bacterium]|nr:TetR family transcriptional regulator [Hyphomonadaceae bacterium]